MNKERNHQSALLHKGVCLFNMKEYVQARKVLEHVNKINPRIPKALNFLGQIEVKEGNFKGAKNYFDLGLEIDPNDYEILTEKGKYLYILGKIEEAIECFNKALKIEPNYEIAKNERKKANKYIKHKKEINEKAENAFKELKNEKKDDVEKYSSDNSENLILNPQRGDGFQDQLSDNIFSKPQKLDINLQTDTCSNCGELIDELADFCGNCGSNLRYKRVKKQRTRNERTIPEIRCPICNHPIESSHGFCGNCGFKLKEDILGGSKNMGHMEFDEMNIMNLMGLHCLKCGSQNSLRLFEHMEIISKSHKRYTSIRTLSIKIPLCRVCNSELEAWKDKHGVERSAYSEVLGLFCCGLVVGALTIQSLPWLSLIIFSLMGLGILHIYRSRKFKEQLDSPFRYVKFVGNDAFVNPKGSGNWIKYKSWLNLISKYK